MNNKGVTLLVFATFFVPGFSTAGDADSGEVKAKACMECHYADDFAGETEDAVRSLIEGTVSEGSEHPSDNKGMSEEDIADIAAFFVRGK